MPLEWCRPLEPSLVSQLQAPDVVDKHVEVDDPFVNDGETAGGIDEEACRHGPFAPEVVKVGEDDLAQEAAEQ
jgi:hypothetical protein